VSARWIGVILALLPACKGHGPGAAPTADAGVIPVPSQLRACPDLPACEADCTLGSGPGCNLAGRAHEFGHGAPVDLGKALAFYERACDEGYMGGCYNVAVTVENGRGTPRDEARAAALYLKVCEAGSQVACAAAHRLASTP
jgi:TPR repeat protein